MVTLRPITRENWRAALALTVQPDQLRFVSATPCPVALALAKAYIQPNGLPLAPYGIYADEQIVGFFALVYDPDSHDRYWITHFFIDRHCQRRGYGRAALDALVTLLREHYPRCRSVSLTVHPENQAAQELYTRFGFTDTGTLLDGEPCYRLALADAAPPLVKTDHQGYVSQCDDADA